jgi:hypothetical protein
LAKSLAEPDDFLGLKSYEQAARYRGLLVFNRRLRCGEVAVKRKSPARGFFVCSGSDSKNRLALPAILPSQLTQK